MTPNTTLKRFRKFGTLIFSHIGINIGTTGTKNLSKKDTLPEELKPCAVAGDQPAKTWNNCKMEKALLTHQALKLNQLCCKLCGNTDCLLAVEKHFGF